LRITATCPLASRAAALAGPDASLSMDSVSAARASGAFRALRAGA